MGPEYLDMIDDFTSLFIDNLHLIIYSLLVLLIMFIINWIAHKIINNRIDNIALRYRRRKLITYFLLCISIIAIIFIWGTFQHIATYLGLLGAGLVIALRGPLTNILSWIFIIWRQPFSIGDRIEIDGTAGDVIDIRMFQFSIVEIRNWIEADQSTGRVVHIPNKKILDHELANFNKDFSFIWDEIPVLITFESDWEKAKSLLLDIAQKKGETEIKQANHELQQASKKYYIYFRKLTPIVYTSVKESGVLLTIRYLCRPRVRRTKENDIWESILQHFAMEPDINLAYPTVRRVETQNMDQQKQITDKNDI